MNYHFLIERIGLFNGGEMNLLHQYIIHQAIPEKISNTAELAKLLHLLTF